LLSSFPEKQSTRTDLYGDPLPTGASARLGTVRFRHPGAVHAVAFSKDGKLLAASSDDRIMVVIWDRTTGRKLREIPTRNGWLPTDLRFSPDGKRLYAQLHAWDVESGADAKDFPSPPAGAGVIGYSPDNREVLLHLHKEAKILRWDLSKGKEMGRYPRPDGEPRAAVRVGERLLVALFEGQSVDMWDAVQNKQLWSIKATRDSNRPSLPMAFSADGKLFVVEAPARVISVYESVTGKRVRGLEGDVSDIYYSLCFSPDARTVAGSCWDGSLQLWDLQSGRQRAKIPALHGWVTDVFFAADSKVFATGGPNNTHGVLLWETATGKQIDHFPGHTTPISWVAFSPDGRTAATCALLRGDRIVLLWDPRTGRLLRTFEAMDAYGVSAVAFSPDGGTLAACSCGGENAVRLWDVRTGRVRHTQASHEAGCTCIAFSPDGKRLVSGGAFRNPMGRQREGRLCIWDAEAGKLIREIRGIRGSIARVLFSREGRHVLAAAEGVHVYDAETGQLIGTPLLAKIQICGLALSGDGRLLATGDGHGRVQLWELATRREIPLTLPGVKGYGIDLTPDGRILVALGPKGDIVFFHWPSGEMVGKLPDEAKGRWLVMLSPDNRRLATLESSESSALVWDVTGLVSRPLPVIAQPAEADLRRWWVDLADASPGKAYKAVWQFIAAPEQTVPFIAGVLRPVKPAETAVVARLIADLDSPKFQVRQKASQELERLGESAVGGLQKVRNGASSIEQARQIDRLLNKFEGRVPGPEQLRATRAVTTLEQIGGQTARKVVAGLAAGAAGARLTREAEAALDRLRRAKK
jgi:WD40 repeat protein